VNKLKIREDTMNRIALVLSPLVVLAACSTDLPIAPSSVVAPVALATTTGVADAAVGTAAAVTETSTFSFPLPQPFQRFVPCAAGGSGELVDLSGTLHLVMHTTVDGRGGFHSRLLVHPQGVTGVGLTTGDRYQGTGGTQTQLNGTVGKENTFVDNFRLIGHGPGNNLLLHQTVHMTVNASGEVTANLSNISLDCR
jgi:hypothetical protein